MSIGTRLKELREQNGLSQVQAAARVGMKQQAWRVYETDSSMPGAKLIVKICAEYDVSADWLLGLKERGTSAAPGERPDCKACPHMAKLRKLEEIMGK